jgi:tRNA A37 N6-isopentenylltransferase MiaA
MLGGLLEETEYLVRNFSPTVYLLRKGVYYRNLALYLRGSASLGEALDSINMQLLEIAQSQRKRYETESRLIWLEVHPEGSEVLADQIFSIYRGRES